MDTFLRGFGNVLCGLGGFAFKVVFWLCVGLVVMAMFGGRLGI